MIGTLRERLFCSPTHRLFAAALGVSLAQAALSLRFPYANDYVVTLVVAWAAALGFAAQPADALPLRPPRAGARAKVWRSLGALAVLGSLAPMVAAGEYRTVDRATPLLAGIGLCLAASGPLGIAARWRELLLLALPLLNPLPRVVMNALAPVHFTTWCTMQLDRLAGHPVAADGNLLLFPHGTLEVLPGCSGLLGTTRLWVLAALVVALFPTTRRQRIALAVVAVAVGFLGNLARLIVLSFTLMRGDDAAFLYWHQGTGSTWYALASTAVAGLAWWLLLRRPGRPAYTGGLHT